MRPLAPVPAPETCPQCGQWCTGADRAEHLRVWRGSETTWRERCQPVGWPLGDVDCGQADETPAVGVAAGRGVRPGQGAGRTPVTPEQALRHVMDELAHHLTEADDPCQDRGVWWPCDVARALQEARHG